MRWGSILDKLLLTDEHYKQLHEGNWVHKPPRLLIVAHTYRIGKYYAGKFEEPNAAIVTMAEGLYGIVPGPDCPDIVVINSDDGGYFSRGIVQRLRYLEASGVKIDWLG